MPLTSYSELKDSDKQRLAATWVNIKDQNSALAKVQELPLGANLLACKVANLLQKVNCDRAAYDYNPAGKIKGASLKTFVSKLRRDYARLSPSDKSRLAACIVNISDDDLKSVFKTVRNPPFPWDI